MKIIAKQTKLYFRNSALPSSWDYDLVGCFFVKADAWAAGTGSPVDYLFSYGSVLGVKHLESESASATDVALVNGDILRLFGGDMFLKYQNNGFELISDRQVETIELTNGATYDYNSELGRIATTPTAREGWCCAAIAVNAGDIIAYKGSSGSIPRLLGWQDNETVFITPPSAVCTSDAGYMYYLVPSNGIVYYNGALNNTHDLKILRKN